MRVVVTGASGNVGSALLRRLHADGGHQVVGLVRRTPEPTDDVPPHLAAVDWVPVDLSREGSAPTLWQAFEGADAVVHLAWGFQPSHDTAYLEELGTGGTRRVLDAVAAADVPHLVHMSSVGAYSAKRDDRPVDESWPTDGIPTSWYSRSKAAAERLLDAHERAGTTTVLTRLRPGIVGQRSAGSALLRYGVPGFVPGRALSLLPVLPVDRGLTIPLVHSDDVADAIVRVLDRKAAGAFNLAAEPPLTAARMAEVLGARLVHVPSGVLRPVVAASWKVHLQQVDPGWLDMGSTVPLLDCGRAFRELGWTPTVDAMTVFREVVDGMRDTASDRTPVLRPRTVLGQAREALRRGPVSERQRP
ncbi:NAD-dependent epimerase/dehydratase family protein [Nocardioides caldifontis]|uniref:NAD-dependent epimerase/dehydratase family protein n=1 Tax=Nocardioides caldifontis TaxID=2588938 RepID=UPI0011E0182A|nr:NAD-dependent epimerase/dehydratase family protein [Nocardioides caldifontis]